MFFVFFVCVGGGVSEDFGSCMCCAVNNKYYHICIYLPCGLLGLILGLMNLSPTLGVVLEGIDRSELLFDRLMFSSSFFRPSPSLRFVEYFLLFRSSGVFIRD